MIAVDKLMTQSLFGFGGGGGGAISNVGMEALSFTNFPGWFLLGDEGIVTEGVSEGDLCLLSLLLI